jgi:hypothetical protein
MMEAVRASSVTDQCTFRNAPIDGAETTLRVNHYTLAAAECLLFIQLPT